MTSPRLEQGMRQSMVMGASMQLFVRALQASQMELSHMATQAISTNPVLEEDSTPAPEGDTASAPDYEAAKRHEYVMESLPEPTTLSTHLAEQVKQSALPEKLEAAALDLIAHIDSHGFFPENPSSYGIPPALLDRALRVVQDLEPAGVGARDLRESLLLQLERTGDRHSLAYRLVHERWDDLTRHRYAEAAHALGVNDDQLSIAVHRISRLNPDPGSSFAPTERVIIAPDVIVLREKDKLTVHLTGEMVPRLSLSPQYREMLAEKCDQEDVRQYLTQCFRDARELIRAIEKRQATILAVTQAIVERQRAFFLSGPSHLAPLKMEDIASATGLHVSTISRAVNGKYLRCSYGLFELRSFFSAALNETSDEGPLTGDSVRSRIRSLIEREDPRKPLSDAKIEGLLARDGIRIARRTIAKYREQLRILPASLRKRV